MSCLTVERLKELLEYDPATGLFTNRVPRGNLTVDTPIGWENGKGYKRLKIDGGRYMAHLVAWLYMTGEMPKSKIDHKNGVTSDNRWDNLREATDLQNTYNKGLYKNNRLGIKGVTQTSSGSYMVRVNHKSYGCYKDLELAEFVAQEVREGLHGEFARHV